MAQALWKVKPPLGSPTGGIWVGASGRAGQDGVWLGTLGEVVSGKQPQVWLSTAKEQVVAVVGKRGSGKSFTLGVVAEGLCASEEVSTVGVQHRRRATLLFDPLDVYWTSRFPVVASANAEANRHFGLAQAMRLTGLRFDVEAWVPGAASLRATDPPWFGVLELPVREVGLEEWGLLLDVNVVSEPMGQALVDAVQLAVRSGYRLRGAREEPKANYGLADLARVTESEELAGAYHPETLRALRQRVGALNQTGLFSSVGTPIVDLLAPGRLSVVLLSRLPHDYRGAVVALLTRMLVEARARASFAEKRLTLDPTLTEEEREALAKELAVAVPRTVVALDEAQSFLGSGREGIAREVFVRLVKEGRNVGLSALLATQQPSAIDSRILSQVETFVAHQLVTEPDIQAVRANLKASLPESTEYGKDDMKPTEMLRMLTPGQCLVSAADMNTAVRRSLLVNVRPRATVHGGIEL